MIAKTKKHLDDYKVDVPEGISGDWQVEKFTVTQADEDFGKLRASFSFSSGGRFVPAGEYTSLRRGRTMVMSDTPDEIRDHLKAIRVSSGHCLVNGLGLGMIVQAMCLRDSVDRVTVIEKSEDVIALVAGHYLARFPRKLEVIHADAYTWKPPRGVRYDCVWHDIWDNVCGDNLPEMTKLHRKYGRRCDWQGSWGRDRCRR